MLDRDAAPEIRTSHVPGTPRIAYDECGSGVPVVFLHGIGGNRTNWREQLLALGRTFHAVAWDARGYGLSNDYDGALDFDIFNADLNRLLDHIGAEKAAIVGLSMGGRILQFFYRHFPQRVALAVLCDTLERPPGSSDPEFRARFLAERKAPLLAGKTPRDIAPKVAASLASHDCKPEAMQMLVDSISQLRTSSYLKALDALAAHDEVARLPDFEIPVCLIYGEEDRLTTPQMGRDLAERIRDSEFHEIAKAGHLANLEAPEEFNAILLDFLKRRLPPSLSGAKARAAVQE